MNKQIQQIKDNVESIKKGCGNSYLCTPLIQGQYHCNPDYKCGIKNKLGLFHCKICESKLKTTIAENIKWADAMFEELNTELDILFYCLDDDNVKEVNEMIEIRHKEHKNKLKQWQELKQWLEERQ